MLGFSWPIDSVQRLFGSWQAMQPNMNIATAAPLATAQVLNLGYTYHFLPSANNFHVFAGSRVIAVGIGLRHLF